MKRFAHILLATALFTLLTKADAAANASSNTNVSPAERAKIEEVVRQYLLRKPEVLVEALQVLQQKQFEEAQKTTKQTQQDAIQFADRLFHQPSDPVGGNPNGKITVVEFFDYQCPHCIDMAPVMDAVVKANPEVRIIFKDFPIRGPLSELAARAALAANKQGKYVEFSHALLSVKQPLTQEVIFQIAKTNGLDVEKLKKDMDDSSINSQLQANDKLARDLKLIGTPAFFIAKSTVSKNNGRINYIPGQIDQKQLQVEIEKASQ